MRTVYILIVLLVLCVSSSAQTSSNDNLETYNYDTTLKGGYKILYKADDSLQHLYLKKDNKIIAELASTSKRMLDKNLGYVGADFKDCFVLVHSFGAGNPHYIELIKKATGKNIFSKGAAWIDANEKEQVLLYCDNDMPTQKSKMTLYNVSTEQKQMFNFPGDIFNEPDVLNRIQIKNLNDKQLIINYQTDTGLKSKVYSR